MRSEWIKIKGVVVGYRLDNIQVRLPDQFIGMGNLIVYDVLKTLAVQELAKRLGREIEDCETGVSQFLIQYLYGFDDEVMQAIEDDKDA